MPFFFLSNFQALKFFVTLFSGTVRPRRLKLGTHMDSGGARWLSGRVSDSGARGRGFETYRRRVVSLSKTLYSPKVLVNYPGINMTEKLLTGTLSLNTNKQTHGQWVDVSCIRNQAAAAFLSVTLKFFITLFPGTVRPRRLKHGNKWTVGRCIVYTGIRLLLLICPIFSFFFQFSNIKVFVRPRSLKHGTHMDNGWMYHVY